MIFFLSFFEGNLNPGDFRSAFGGGKTKPQDLKTNGRIATGWYTLNYCVLFLARTISFSHDCFIINPVITVQGFCDGQSPKSGPPLEG